jgi:hypothetical protein
MGCLLWPGQCRACSETANRNMHEKSRQRQGWRSKPPVLPRPALKIKCERFVINGHWSAASSLLRLSTCRCQHSRYSLRSACTSGTTSGLVSLCCRTCPGVWVGEFRNSNPIGEARSSERHNCALTICVELVNSLSSKPVVIMRKRRFALDTSPRRAEPPDSQGRPAQTE